MSYTMLDTTPSLSNMPDLTEFVSTEEAAERLGFHVQTIRNMLTTNKLQGIKIGRTWLVYKTSLEEYVKDNQGLSKHDPRRKQK